MTTSPFHGPSRTPATADTTYATFIGGSSTATIPAIEYVEACVMRCERRTDGTYRQVGPELVGHWADEILADDGQQVTWGRSAEQQMLDAGWRYTGRIVPMTHGSGGYAEVMAPALVNLTPHAVRVYDGADVIADVPPSGTVARLVESVADADRVGPARGVVVTLGEVDGLPDPVDGTVYIASMPLLMGMAAAGIRRADVVYPFKQVRDTQGRIIGCRSLARIA